VAQTDSRWLDLPALPNTLAAIPRTRATYDAPLEGSTPARNKSVAWPIMLSIGDIMFGM
jgi:hypothetical protein